MDARTRWNPSAKRPPRRGWIARTLREPLLHFLLAGAVIFLAASAWRSSHDQHRIMVTPERIAELAGKHRMQFGRAPTPAELEQLVSAWTEEEMLYREGRALGLDRDDEIVRRRVAQKVAFLRQDLSIPAEPSEADVERYFRSHAAAYVQPDRVSFRHLYFSPDAAGAGEARSRAQQALERLQAGGSPDSIHADPFPDRAAYVGVSAEEARRLFGRTELARVLTGLPAGRWSGPFRSGYGWHLVLVQGRYAGAPGEFAKLKDAVRADYLRDVQAAANARAMAELRARYTVVRRDARP